MNKIRKAFRKTGRFFFQGLFYLAPFTITLFIIYKLLKFLITSMDGLLPYHIPGLGLLVIIIGITIIGFLGSTIIFKPLLKAVDKIMDRAPLIRIIYSAIRDLLSAFVGTEKKFDKPVLIRMYKTADIEKLGFITSEDLSNLGIGNDKVAVYMPHSYNFSGNLFIVPRENITPIDASSTDIMKYIVSGGVAQFKKK